MDMILKAKIRANIMTEANHMDDLNDMNRLNDMYEMIAHTNSTLKRDPIKNRRARW